MNTISIRSLDGTSFTPPESAPGGGGSGFDGLLRSELGASPSREALGAPQNPNGARGEARFETGASQQDRTARSSPAKTSTRREVDESDAAETAAAAIAETAEKEEVATAGPDTAEEEGGRAERLRDEVVVPFESGERIGDTVAPGDATAGAAFGEVEIATAATAAVQAGRAGGAAGQISGRADAASTATTSGGGSAAVAAVASTAGAQAASRARSDAGDSGAVLSTGSGDGLARAASAADSVRGAVPESVVTSNDGSSSTSTSQAVEAVASGSGQEAIADARARVESRASAAEAGESERVRTGTEALEARSDGRAASLASGEVGRVAAIGSSRSEGAASAIDSAEAGRQAAREGLHGSQRHGASDREGGEGPPRDDRSIDLRLTNRESQAGLAARAEFDPAIGVGSAVPAPSAVDASTGAATQVQVLPSANVGATAQLGAESPPAGASPPAPAADALAVQTEWLATRGGGSARLVLHPPELGELAIRVSVRDGSVDVVMIAHEAAAKAIAEEQSDRLAQAFSARDLRMGSFEVRQAESRAEMEGRPDAGLGNPDARDGGQSRRDSNAASDGRVDRVAGGSSSLSGRPAGPPTQAFPTPAERSVDLRI